MCERSRSCFLRASGCALFCLRYHYSTFAFTCQEFLRKFFKIFCDCQPFSVSSCIFSGFRLGVARCSGVPGRHTPGGGSRARLSGRVRVVTTRKK
uniref:Uncharacterized protein n=1 Tax=Siphoviridae sp. ctO0R2 TaxID=2825476 RepID=A0A8S5PEX2_9CAUD|nr:MAG TPA: hypothetical protein [Siphoviridae sp. ctO0R2]